MKLDEFVEQIVEDRLNTTSDIVFEGSWSQIANQLYSNDIKPVDLLVRILRAQVEHGVKILPSENMLSESTAKKPPILPMSNQEQGVFGLWGLDDKIRVINLNFYDFVGNRFFDKYLQLRRKDVPHWAVFFKQRELIDETKTINAVKKAVMKAGGLFQSGLDLEKPVDQLLVQLWRQFISAELPHYK